MAAELYPLTVSGVVQETRDARSFLLAVPAALRDRFRYRAGQFLTFEVPFRGMQLRRCYSLASAPETDPWPKVTVKRVADGRVSNWFNEAIAVGTVVRVLPPEGRFVLDPAERSRPVALFGGGSGITPLISILKSALAATARPVKLVYANRDAESVIFADELRLLERTYPGRLQVAHHLDAQAGFLATAGIVGHLAGYEDADVYTCGPAPFMDAVDAALDQLGIADGRRHFERFVSSIDPDRRPDAPPPPTTTGAVPATFTMIRDGATHEIPYRPGLTLLAAAQAAGHQPPSSCEEGYCGCCMAQLRSGKVEMTSREALGERDLERGWVLPCQARPTSDEPLVVDFDATY